MAAKRGRYLPSFLIAVDMYHLLIHWGCYLAFIVFEKGTRMNAKTLSILAIGLWLAGAGAVATMYIGGKTEQAPDGREAVIVSASERNFILGEMRNMLASVQGIVSAAAAGDMQSVEEIALAIGSAEVRNVPKSLMLKLPRDFKTRGTENHLEFDDVAAQSKNGSKAVLERLSDLMINCVGCHESYSLKAE